MGDESHVTRRRAGRRGRAEVLQQEPLPLPSPDTVPEPLLRALGGPEAPKEWQGAMPFTYRVGGGPARVRVQHAKQRMTVFERIKVLTDREPNLMWQNWGKGLDGASLVTAVVDIGAHSTEIVIYYGEALLAASSLPISALTLSRPDCAACTLSAPA